MSGILKTEYPRIQALSQDKASTTDSLGGAEVGDPGATTINIKKFRRRPPWEVPELEIRERPPSTLRNVDGGPSGGVRAGDPRTPTINAKKHRRWALRRRRS
jgi:hypothetical protein